MSFTGINPIETRSINGVSHFNVNNDRLDASQSHIFYATHLEPQTTNLALLAFEKISFHRSNSTTTSLFKTQNRILNTLQITWISFPKEHKATFEKIAKIYNLTVSIKSRYMITAGCIFHISGSPQTLSLYPTTTTKAAMTHSEISSEIERILWFSDQLERLDVD
jgi:hypothetical protein